MRVKVLLIASERWISTARLAMALIETGCEVDAVCRNHHPLLLISGLAKRYHYRDLKPIKSVRSAIQTSAPDLVICCDEETFRLAHRIYREAVTRNDLFTRELLECSFGVPKHYGIELSRFGLMVLAGEELVKTPPSLQVDSYAELRTAEDKLGWPLVLKSDGSFGGNGVRVAQNASQALTFWRRLRGPIGPLRTVNRVLMSKRFKPLYAMLRRQRHTVVAQKLIVGPEATLAASCWRGELLACHCMEVVESWNLRGPSSVLRVIESEPMLAAARMLIRRLGISGFCGFDFIVEATTGTPFLIEMNVRPTQTSHLALGPGKDLIVSLVRTVEANKNKRELPTEDNEADTGWRAQVTHQEFIALFPQELQRDPESQWLRLGFHDIPLSEPALVMAATREPKKSRYEWLKTRLPEAIRIRL